MHVRGNTHVRYPQQLVFDPIMEQTPPQKLMLYVVPNVTMNPMMLGFRHWIKRKKVINLAGGLGIVSVQWMIRM